jgi:hypothetical protein
MANNKRYADLWYVWLLNKIAEQWNDGIYIWNLLVKETDCNTPILCSSCCLDFMCPHGKQ